VPSRKRSSSSRASARCQARAGSRGAGGNQETPRPCWVSRTGGKGEQGQGRTGSGDGAVRPEAQPAQAGPGRKARPWARASGGAGSYGGRHCLARQGGAGGRGSGGGGGDGAGQDWRRWGPPARPRGRGTGHRPGMVALKGAEEGGRTMGRRREMTLSCTRGPWWTRRGRGVGVLPATWQSPRAPGQRTTTPRATSSGPPPELRLRR